MCQRRLHRGGFVWPKATDSCFSMTPDEWRWLVAGVDWQRLSAAPAAHWQP
nr:transposase [Methylovulum psychrotolerans]